MQAPGPLTLRINAFPDDDKKNSNLHRNPCAMGRGLVSENQEPLATFVCGELRNALKISRSYCSGL